MAQQFPEESDGTLGVPIPAGANQLVVKTSNAAGIMDGPGVWTSVSWSPFHSVNMASWASP